MFIYKKMKYFNLVLITLFILFNGNRFCFAQDTTGAAQDTTKIKVLVLHVIEENWDDLELALPKYKIGKGGYPKPITKKQALEHYKEYKTEKENLRIKENRAFSGFNKEITTVPDEKPKVIHELKQLLLKQGITKDSKLFINHILRYYGKTYLLKEDTFMQDAFRFTGTYFDYSYNKIPEKISLLTDPTKDPGMWGYPRSAYLHIRLVEDLYILSLDEIGNLQIKYEEKVYPLGIGSILELPVKEKDLTREEIDSFKKYYEDKWGFKVVSLGEGSGISSNKDIFHFGTKVTLINYGYEEVE